MSDRLPSVSDAMRHVTTILSKIDEREDRESRHRSALESAQWTAERSLDDLAARLQRDIDAEEQERLDYLNEDLARCDNNIELINAYAAQIEAQIMGWTAESTRSSCWAQAKQAARTNAIRLDPDPDGVVEQLKDIGLEVESLAAQGAPRGGSEAYYVRAFTLVEQARAIHAQVRGHYQALYDDWLTNAMEDAKRQIDRQGSGADAAATEEERSYRAWMENWRREWKVISSAPLVSRDSLRWHEGLEGKVALDPAVYGLYQGMGCDDALRKVDGTRVRLNDAMVFYQDLGGQDESLRAYEDQIWLSLGLVCQHEHKVCLCSATGDMDHSQRLARYVKELSSITGGRVLTSRDDIAQALSEHMRAMDEVLQEKLVGYESVDDFNARNTAKPIPWRLLCVSHFPGCFDERMTSDLISLIKQGPRAGIRVLVQMTDATERSLGHMGELVERLKKSPNTFMPHWNSGTLLGWEGSAGRNVYLQLPAVSPRDVETIIATTAEAAKQRAKTSLDLAIFLKEQQYQRCSTAKRLVLPFGINEDGNVQSMRLGDAVAHGSSIFTLVVGPAGSGKSVFLHDLIIGALYNYPPSELQLCLLDFKEGTEFLPYAEARLPHLRYVALDSMQQFAESVLAKLVELLRKRADAFKAASVNGAHISNIAAYREAGYSMPRILVVMDEFQELFDCDRDRRCANRVATLFGELIAKGRAFGIHFVLATQTLHRIYEGNYSIARATIDELHVRVGLKCIEQEFAKLMGADKVADCLRKADLGRGSAVYMEDYAYGSPVGVRVAFMEPARRVKVLRQIEATYADKDFKRAYVFRGTQEERVPLCKASQMSAQNKRIYVGKPIAIGRNVGIDVAPGSQSNLLVIGEDQRMLGRIATTVMGQMAENGTTNRVFLFDGDSMRAGGSSAGVLGRLGSMGVIVPSGLVRSADNAFQVLPVLSEAYELFDSRRQALASGRATSRDNEPAYLVVCNYQLIDPLVSLMEGKSVAMYETAVATPAAPTPRSDDPLQAMLDELSAEISGPRPTASSTATPRVMLRTLLESGHLCNFHVVMTCGGTVALGRLMRSDLAPFTHRVVLPAATGVHTYVDTDIDLKSVGPNCTLYSDGQNETCLIKPFEVIVNRGEQS